MYDSDALFKARLETLCVQPINHPSSFASRRRRCTPMPISSGSSLGSVRSGIAPG